MAKDPNFSSWAGTSQENAATLKDALRVSKKVADAVYLGEKAIRDSRKAPLSSEALSGVDNCAVLIKRAVKKLQDPSIGSGERLFLIEEMHAYLDTMSQYLKGKVKTS